MIPNPFRKQKKRSTVLVSSSDLADLCCSGYTRLDRRPEVVGAARTIAELIGSMTIYLMANTAEGDIRVNNELSRKIDILPNRYMTRSTFVNAIVMNMLLYGSGNSIVVPVTNNGYLEDLIPISASRVSFTPKMDGSYTVDIDGMPHDPADLLHFVWNPDKDYLWKGQGVTATIKEVADNLRQAAATEKGFMASKWKPSLIVKVDALIDDFSNSTGRKKLLEDYISTSEAGEPWMVPSGAIEVEQVKPLSLADLAISDMVEIDKRTVASMFRVPAFVLGVGDYNADAWNAFINHTIRPIAQEIEQELTRKLILSPKMFVRFNTASLFAYDMEKIANVYGNSYKMGLVTGNEYRDKIGMGPKDGLDDLVILENYIPVDKVGDQLKLKQEA